MKKQKSGKDPGCDGVPRRLRLQSYKFINALKPKLI
jgi:hypothetical protein